VAGITLQRKVLGSFVHVSTPRSRQRVARPAGPLGGERTKPIIARNRSVRVLREDGLRVARVAAVGHLFLKAAILKSAFDRSATNLAASLPASFCCSVKDEKRTAVKNIFVGNLDFGSTESSIRSLFEPYGTVERVNLVIDRDTGRSRGFAFVEMADPGQADQAITALNGFQVEGRALSVNEARPKPSNGRGGSPNEGGRQRRQSRW
jgi:cold-inducible RNA-binding protein